jgi:hypothetical protein
MVSREKGQKQTSSVSERLLKVSKIVTEVVARHLGLPGPQKRPSFPRKASASFSCQCLMLALADWDAYSAFREGG